MAAHGEKPMAIDTTRLSRPQGEDGRPDETRGERFRVKAPAYVGTVGAKHERSRRLQHTTPKSTTSSPSTCSSVLASGHPYRGGAIVSAGGLKCLLRSWSERPRGGRSGWRKRLSSGSRIWRQAAVSGPRSRHSTGLQIRESGPLGAGGFRVAFGVPPVALSPGTLPGGSVGTAPVLTLLVPAGAAGPSGGRWLLRHARGTTRPTPITCSCSEADRRARRGRFRRVPSRDGHASRAGRPTAAQGARSFSWLAHRRRRRGG
jgi:hypothetical protein